MSSQSPMRHQRRVKVPHLAEPSRSNQDPVQQQHKAWSCAFLHFYSCRTFSCLTRGESDYGRNPFSQPSYLSSSLSYCYIPFPQYFNISLSLSQLSLPHCSLARQHSLSLSCDIVLLLTSGLCGSQMYYSMMWPIIEIQRTIYFLTLSLFGPFHAINKTRMSHDS